MRCGNILAKSVKFHDAISQGLTNAHKRFLICLSAAVRLRFSVICRHGGIVFHISSFCKLYGFGEFYILVVGGKHVTMRIDGGAGPTRWHMAALRRSTGRDSMLRTVLTASAALALIVGTAAGAAPCRDAKGKFIKCPSPAAATAPAGNVVKDAKGKCHIASGPKKGQFTKCR